MIVGRPRGLGPELERGLRRRRFDVGRSPGADAAIASLTEASADVVLAAATLSDGTAIELARRLDDARPDLPVVVVADSGTLEEALEAFRAGAYDYLAEAPRIETLALALDRAVQHRRLRREVRRLRRVIREAGRFEKLIGESPAMLEVFDLIERVAGSRSSVLVCGDTGTGKELVAQALHSRGPRSAGPFVAVNCAAVPETLLESELFGHVKGAFTDARTHRKGLFLQADGGTILLDEIGDMPLALQPKLLRTLQERCVRPVGSDRESPFDARVIASTHVDLDRLVEDGAFRRDLYYRLNVITVELPPLRRRGGDILLLAQKFIDASLEAAEKGVAGITLDASRRLLDYPWPGNVRELHNCVERAVALADGSEIALPDLPRRVRDFEPHHPLPVVPVAEEFVPLSVVEERHVRRVLAAHGGNKSLASRTLGLDRKTLYRKLQRYGLLTEDESKRNTSDGE